MTTGLPDGVRSRDVETARLTTRVLEVEGRDGGDPVILVHGNVSSSLFFVDLLIALPERYRPVAPDLRGYGGTEVLSVDASATGPTTCSRWPTRWGSGRSTCSAGAWAAGSRCRCCSTRRTGCAP